MKKLSKQYAAKNDPSAPQANITKKDVIKYFARLDPERRGDYLRAAKQRVRTRIDTAVAKGELVEFTWRGKPSFVFGRFAAWAEDNLPELFDRLPHKPLVIRDRNVEVTGMAGRGKVGSVAPTSIPATLLECQERLAEAQLKIHELEGRAARRPKKAK